MKRVFTIPERVHGGSRVQMTWQSQHANFLAVTGQSKLVTIYDRHGELMDEIVLPGVCTGLCWDRDGDVLAIGNEKNGILFLWEAHAMKTTQLDSGLKDSVSYLMWSKVSPLLAVGTSKGNLLLYNHQNSRKIPVIGKHTKRVTCGCWNAENLLALGSEDKIITISNSDGDTVKQTTARMQPDAIQFSVMKTDERSVAETTLSLTVGQRTLFLYNLNEPDNPIELAFQPRYGNIVKYRWFGDGYIMIGFSTGYLVVISTHLKEIGQELFQTQDHKQQLTDIAISLSLKKAASCGDNIIKIHDLNDLKEIYAIINVEDAGGPLDKLEWSEDGQLLALSTQKGAIHVYLTKLPILGDAFNTKVAYLTSLREITIVDITNPETSITVATDVEPNFLGLGPDHLASGMNNRVWFCSITDTGYSPFKDREYLGTVNQVCLNSEYAAVGFEGKLQLHLLENDVTENYEGKLREEEREGKLFPDDNDKITCFTLRNNFLIYGTEGGMLRFFYLEDWANVIEYRHVVGIRNIYSDIMATKLVFVDDKCDGFVYNPVNDNMHEVTDFPPTVKSIFWDEFLIDKSVFCCCDEERVNLYSFNRDNISGPECKLAVSTKLTFGYSPLTLYNGTLSCQTQSGKLVDLKLVADVPSDTPEEGIVTSLHHMIALNRLEDAWVLCESLNKAQYWKLLAENAANQLNITLGLFLLDSQTYKTILSTIRVHRKLGNVPFVMALEKLKDCEDKHLLAGHIALLLKNFNLAQDLFLLSGKPIEALEMRRLLLHWDQALELAKTLAEDQIPFISKEYAQQLEFVGDYSHALENYQRGVSNIPENADHDESCEGGIARMAIRMGDTRKGVSIASKSKNKQLQKDCASLLEVLKQYADSAMLFDKAENWERAAAVYIKMKQWNKVGELLTHVNSPKLLLQYAKAKEHDGKYKQALQAYTKAKDYESVIRINLEHLHKPEEAVHVVRETQSVEGAKMVAKFFQGLGDYASAIQFLVMSQCNDEAFSLAQQHEQMKQYAEIIGDAATVEDCNNMAVYFENQRDYLLAGKFYMLAQHYQKAVAHLLRCPVTEDGESVTLAIQTVKHADDEKLTLTLIDFLMGEIDGIAKDSRYLFQLYMALERYHEAAKTAVIIAQSEQEIGNYRTSHDLLFSMYKELRDRNIKIPMEMNQNLMILHSYILCKMHIKRGDHVKAARLLIRVANNISKFPQHVVPILTSTVIECHRAGLKNHSFSFAAMLMRPEYRPHIDPKYKKKIEMIVRKPDKTEEEEPLTPCPYCSYQVSETRLDCPECKQNIPYCIITGRHMVKEDWCVCPNCFFPSLCAEFKSLLDGEETKCPMCAESVTINSLKADPTLFLRQDDKSVPPPPNDIS